VKENEIQFYLSRAKKEDEGLYSKRTKTNEDKHKVFTVQKPHKEISYLHF